MLEKRQKNKPLPKSEQLDLVESISLSDRLFSKRRLIAFVLVASVLTSLFFMIYGQLIKGKKFPPISIPSINFSLPDGKVPQIVITAPSLPPTVSYLIVLKNLATNSTWQKVTPSSLEFTPPHDLETNLTSPSPNDPIYSKLPLGLNITAYRQVADSTASFYYSFQSPRHHFILAYKFLGPASELEAISNQLPALVESAYWEIIDQL